MSNINSVFVYAPCDNDEVSFRSADGGKMTKQFFGGNQKQWIRAASMFKEVETFGKYGDGQLYLNMPSTDMDNKYRKKSMKFRKSLILVDQTQDLRDFYLNMILPFHKKNRTKEQKTPFDC